MCYVPRMLHETHLSTWKNSPDFYLEVNPVESGENDDVVPSTDDVAPPDNIDQCADREDNAS